jgi:pimeloyl-ACP methyl ester carboxylesterase
VALQVAVTAPERVGALVLMEPLLGFALAPETAAYVGAAAGRAMPLFAAGDHEGALDSWLLDAFGPGYRAELDRALPGAWSTAVVDAPTVFGGEVPALQQWAFDLEDLAQIQAPTLSVVSSAAYWTGFRETHEQLVSRIAGCEGTMVPVPSHLLQIADPQAVAEPVSGFLRRHPFT